MKCTCTTLYVYTAAGPGLFHPFTLKKDLKEKLLIFLISYFLVKISIFCYSLFKIKWKKCYCRVGHGLFSGTIITFTLLLNTFYPETLRKKYVFSMIKKMARTSWRTKKFTASKLTCYVQCWSISINRKMYWIILVFENIKSKINVLHFLSILDHFQVITKKL